ncbi:exonuclease domain-containing protein [Corynebacterium tapiri]|uniref:DNA polymerase III subunit epsilon n=1 Tax=Corynebacterium tapiri TaxID=1448266 RepID=A0A5C4U6I0_9CORY|nr:exonuclease domain-containing protein [Corynebacterium tapiri]TNL99367.1 DNA polymerase III subunit epsilon [Corynebacterium tapiri]
MFKAHGATVTVTADSVEVQRSALSAALLGDELLSIPLSEITGVHIEEPTELDRGAVLLDGTQHSIAFAPLQQEQAQALSEAIERARNGEAPTTSGVTGLDFVAFDVETANPAFGSVCQIGMAKFRDGELAETRSWLCKPPQGLDDFQPKNMEIHGITPEDVADAPAFADAAAEALEFLGDMPFVAHNAQFDATALRDAAQATSLDLPDILFGCSLALARAASLKVKNHKLPTLAEHFHADLSQHHNAEADAIACGGIIVGLASERNYRGELMGLFHDAGFTLGRIAEGKVTPVLKDRSGAARALQLKGHTTASPLGEPGAGTDFRSTEDSAQEKKPTRGRGPAPWSKVATPETIPEPNQAADPNDPLYGQQVTLTGDFEPFDKGQLWQAIAEHGGQVAKNVTKKSTILVIGSWGSMTSKEKRARELMDKGQDIQLWPADKLLEVLGLSEEPPF